MGKSGLVGRKIAATLASTGTPAYFLHPAEGVHGDLGMLARGDVVLALSNSGETDEVLAVLPGAQAARHPRSSCSPARRRPPSRARPTSCWTSAWPRRRAP